MKRKREEHQASLAARLQESAPDRVVLMCGHEDPATAEQWMLWKRGEFIDLHLQARGPSTLGCSKIIMAAASPYIRKLLLGSADLKPISGDNIYIDLPDSADALRAIVEALYSKKLLLSWREGPNYVTDIMRVASFLAIASVYDACQSFILDSMSPTTCLGVAEIAERENFSEVKCAALKYAEDNFQSLLEEAEVSGFESLDRGTLEELLCSDALRVESEIEIFTALCNWLQKRAGRSLPDAAAPVAAAHDACCSAEAPPAAATAESGTEPRQAHSGAPAAAGALAAGTAGTEAWREEAAQLLRRVRFQHIPFELQWTHVLRHPLVTADERLRTLCMARPRPTPRVTSPADSPVAVLPRPARCRRPPRTAPRGPPRTRP